jgi:hypothetical protein
LRRGAGFLGLGGASRKGKLWKLADQTFQSFLLKKADFHPPDDLQKINP